MKVIFLDIDGVLNGNLFVPKEDKPGVLIDNTRLELIKQIIDVTDAEIVLSSSWREHWEKNENECNDIGREINEIFSRIGLSVYDKTPKHHNDRKQEIIDWLYEHPDVSEFVVIDDTPFAEGVLQNHFVLTSHLRYGIDENDAKQVISILNCKMGK